VGSSFNLRLLCNFGDDSLTRVLALVRVPVSKALIAQEFSEVTSISGHSGDNHAHVGVDFKHLLLVSGQIVHALFQSDENNMAVGLEGKGSGPLFDGFFGVVNLVNFTFGIKGATVLAVCRGKHAY